MQEADATRSPYSPPLAIFERGRYTSPVGTSLSAAVRPIAPSAIGVGRLARHGDERLARLVAEGSREAFAVLYERYHQQLYRYCHSILHDNADAQDALQATMTAALAALQRDKRLAPVRPWLYRIAHNEAISLIRRRATVAGGDRPDESLAASAEERAGERAQFAVLVADLADLPDRLRAALLMRELSGLSHEEIAVALETSVGAAKQAVFDARRALVDFAQGRTMECDEVRRVVSDRDGRVLRGRRVRAHVRDCAICKAFAASIPSRRVELNAFVPALAAPAAAKLIARVLASGSGNGALTAAGAGVGSTTTAAAGAAAGGVNGGTVVALEAGKVATTTIAAKLAAGGAILATGFGGVTLVRDVVVGPPKHAGVHTTNGVPGLNGQQPGQGSTFSIAARPTAANRSGAAGAGALAQGAAPSQSGSLGAPGGAGAAPIGSGGGGTRGGDPTSGGGATGGGATSGSGATGGGTTSGGSGGGGTSMGTESGSSIGTGTSGSGTSSGSLSSSSSGSGGPSSTATGTVLSGTGAGGGGTSGASATTAPSTMSSPTTTAGSGSSSTTSGSSGTTSGSSSTSSGSSGTTSGSSGTTSGTSGTPSPTDHHGCARGKGHGQGGVGPPTSTSGTTSGSGASTSSQTTPDPQPSGPATTPPCGHNGENPAQRDDPGGPATSA
jgi:RNA polymerase sigma factor (sigma-70 family)